MLITFEGIDGSGKSTQIQLLKERLQELGIHVEVYREPGGTEVSERIRALLLSPSLDIEPFAELLLFSAARAQLVSERIRPALSGGGIVICDRFYDSTTAYQGAGRGLGGLDWMTDFHAKVTRGLIPDRTYFLSIPVSQALERRRKRSEVPEDRMEKTGALFFDKVARAYESLAVRYPQRFLKLDGTRSAEDLHELIWDDIKELRSNSGGTTVLS